MLSPVRAFTFSYMCCRGTNREYSPNSLHISSYASCTLLSRKTVLGLLFLPENLVIIENILYLCHAQFSLYKNNYTTRVRGLIPRHSPCGVIHSYKVELSSNFSGAGVLYALPDKEPFYFFFSFFTSHAIMNANTATIATRMGNECILVSSHQDNSFSTG